MKNAINVMFVFVVVVIILLIGGCKKNSPANQTPKVIDTTKIETIKVFLPEDHKKTINFHLEIDQYRPYLELFYINNNGEEVLVKYDYDSGERITKVYELKKIIPVIVEQ
ncbi:MAG: hypothetical protein ACP5OG_02995 [Candidatus Nanoarchaeia archaeon]